MTTTRLSPDTIGDEYSPLLNNTVISKAKNGHGSNNFGRTDEEPTDSSPTVGTFKKSQVLLLCFCRMVDPIAFFSIVPFINAMVWEVTGITEPNVGFYSGLIESLFSIVQMIVMVPYGRATDRFGRKPVLLWSYAGLAITATLFGFSKTLWQMIILRCSAGLFSGSIVAVRAMVSENSTPTTQALAFSFFGFSGSFGILIGTLIGGFSHPSQNYQSIFGNVSFLKQHPFALPTMISGLLIVSAFLITLFFIDETKDLKAQKCGDSGLSSSQLLRAPGVSIVLFIYCWCSLLGFAYTAVAPLFWFTSIELGGLGFSENWISYFLALGGLAQALWMLFAFPVLQPRFGTGRVLWICVYIWPFFFLLNPLANLLLRSNENAVFWSTVPIALIAGSGVSMAFTGTQLAVNQISPSPSTLGTLNGLALSLNSATRAFTPALFTSIFALGVRDQLLSGQLVWLIMILCTGPLILSLRWLPDKVNNTPTTPEHNEDDSSA